VAQNSPHPTFPTNVMPMHTMTPPQVASDASRSPAVSNGPGFPYNSPNAFNPPQPVPPPAPVPAPTPVAKSPWSSSSMLQVQVSLAILTIGQQSTFSLRILLLLLNFFRISNGRLVVKNFPRYTETHQVKIALIGTSVFSSNTIYICRRGCVLEHDQGRIQHPRFPIK
jgi:hypothetical protein